jgi:hypothetical protein
MFGSVQVLTLCNPLGRSKDLMPDNVKCMSRVLRLEY